LYLSFPDIFYSQDEEQTRRAAIQKVAAGQQAENLLDFDDAPAVEGVAPSGLAAAVANTPGVNKVLTSSNPLDDLVSIFGAGGSGGGGDVFGDTSNSSAAGAGLGGLSTLASPVNNNPPPAFGGMDVFGTTAPQPSTTKPAATSQQDDLLGLF
jgi:AP-1 complex subunit beta-1